MKVIVVGTGYIGLPAALLWAKAGLEVVGVDINENVVRAVNDRTMLLNETELQRLLHDTVVKSHLVAQHDPTYGDIFVIAVPTPVDELRKVADLSHVLAALKSICPYLKQGNLVIIESTVPPMTCQKVIKPLIEELTGYAVPADIKVAHCPERILPGNIFYEIVSNDRLIGGMDEKSTLMAKELYGTFVEGALLSTTDLVAELSKLMENTYRDVNIALANELAQICERLGVDAYDTIRLANRHPRVNILQPGIGVGGHCIPVDPWFLKEIAPYDSRLITLARLINDEMPQRIASKIRRSVNGIPGPRIVALGASYKRNTEDTRESPATEIVHLLRRDGYQIDHYDPLVRGMGYASLAEVCRGVDLVAVLVSHDLLMKDLSALRHELGNIMRNRNVIVFDACD